MRCLSISILRLSCVAIVLSNAHAIKAQTDATLVDLIDGIRPSVVQVAIRIKTRVMPDTGLPQAFRDCFHGTSYCIAGTGIFVNSDGDTVTALHVADGFRSKDGVDHPGVKQVIEALEAAGIHAETVIGVATPNVDNGKVIIEASTNYFPATLIATDPAHDLALIRPSVNPFKDFPRTFSGPGSAGLPQGMAKSVTFSVTRPRDGEAIFACGYPFGEHGLVTTSGTLASAWNSKVLLRSEAAGFSSPVEIYNADLTINPGNSGGPIFRTSDQAVIGMAVESLGSLGVVVPAKFVTAFLTSQKAQWSPAKTTPSQLPNRK